MNSRLPWLPLLALSLAAFVTIVTEALPAGLLAPMAEDLHISLAAAGQSVTLYALGSFLAAIPLMLLLQAVPRRRLLLYTLGSFMLANLLTALTSSYLLMLLARGIAGAAAGVLWSLLAGYAAAMVPASQRGKAIAIAMAGTPLALALGVPLGSWMGNLFGWRLSFVALSGLALLLIGVLRLTAPESAGLPAAQRLPLRQVVALPGVRSVLLLVLCYVLAHNILYTYIAPLLLAAGLLQHTDAVLLLFGLCALLSIVLTGLWVDRALQPLTRLSILLFLLATLLLPLSLQMPWLLWLAVTLWGLAFGGAATLFQTLLLARAGTSGDVAQSMLVTVWNMAIAGGGITGGVLLQNWGVASFAPALWLLLLAALGSVCWLRRAPLPG